MKNRRRRLLIEPRFQIAFILRMTGWVTLATVLTAAIAAAFLAAAENRMAGDFFYIVPEAGAHPTFLTLSKIVLPALAVALPVNLLLTLAFALVYSARLAGPVHRLEQDMLRVARGEKTQMNFQLRDSDELQEVAHAFDAMLKSISERERS